MSKNGIEELRNILVGNKEDPSTLISLGPNCFIKNFLRFLEMDQETHFFDHIGSTLWSLYDLFDNDFAHLFDKNDYVNMHVLQNAHIISNRRYYLNFKHDFLQRFEGGSVYIHHGHFINFKQKYERRISRFKSLLQSGKRILFLRSDLNSNRLPNPLYEEKEAGGDEIYHFRRFIQLLRQKYPSLHPKCTFLFLTKNIEENQFLEDDRLLLIKASKPIEVYETCKFDIFLDLWENRTFLQRYL